MQMSNKVPVKTAHMHMLIWAFVVPISGVGVVGCGEGVVYLTSPGHPTDIGLQLAKACYPCSR